MKTYTRYSGPWKRQKQTQKYQRAAEFMRELKNKRKTAAAPKGQKFLYPERRDRNGKLLPEFQPKWMRSLEAVAL